ncbi:MAG: alpha/beta fold hydrolase [Thiohalomonadales bacterium]
MNTSQDFPPGTNTLIDTVLESEVPELINGETGVANNSGVEIWYESMLTVEKPKATIVLSMGAFSGALAWPKYFYEPLLEAGYRVIRYDHRGLGMSDWISDWQIETAYTLEDMASDVIAILDRLNIDKAHIVGFSLGGMVGQSLAINYPQRILSLASISSSAFLDDPALPDSSISLQINMLKLQLKYGLFPSEENTTDMIVGINYLFKGDGADEIDVVGISQSVLYELRDRQGFNPAVWQQHNTAISKSGSRYNGLRNITAPTVVIHGSSDPVISIAHAKKYVDLIPGARVLWIKGMGHELPKSAMADISAAILTNIERASKASTVKTQ